MTRTLPAVAVVAALLVASMAGPAVVTAQESNSQTITSCTTITEPGTYTLGSDITNASANPCIDIESSDVVLDGDGHTLTGDGDGTAVVANQTENRTADGHSNVTVRDLSVESWGTGLSFAFAPNATVTGVSVTDADLGVELGEGDAIPGYEDHAHGAIVTDSTFENVGSGVVVTQSERVEVHDNAFTNATEDGVHLDTVRDSAVRDNEFVSGGIQLSAEDDDFGEGTHDNVVASNRVVNGSIGVSLDSDYVTDNRIVDNDVTNGSVVVGGDRSSPSNTLVVDNRLTNSDITVGFASNVTVEDNVLANPSEAPDASIHLRDTGQTTVRDNRITGANVGVLIEQLASENTVVDNTATGGQVGVAITRDSVNNTVEGNTLADNDNGVEVSLVDSFRDGTNYVRGNDLVNNTNGVAVLATDQPLVIESNDISDNENGVNVQSSAVCSAGAEGAELLSVHDNTLADNAAYGVLNENRDVLNATSNYWGASDGPSSADDSDAPFEDPETGALANGSGAAVSEDPNAAGQSNVHFDSWLQQPPEDAGAGNESAS